MAGTTRRHDFDEMIPRIGTDSRKHNMYPPDVIPMWVADTDFKCPQPIIDALKARAEHGIFGYTHNDGGLAAAAKHWMNRRFGLDIEEEWAEFAPSVVPALVICIQAFTNPGDKIVIQTPVYHPFHDIIEYNGRVKLENELLFDNSRYSINFEQLERQLADPLTKMLLLCNPHNPVGRVFTREELQRVAELCVKHDVFVVSDEIHCDLVYEGHKHIPFLSVSENIRERSMICINPSKTFNVPGLRTAAAIIPDKTRRERFVRQRLVNKMNGETNFGLLGFKVAYTECEYYVDELMSYLAGNVELMETFFKERIPSIKLIRPEATYLAWLDCRELPIEDKALKGFFLEQAKVALNEGASFGKTGSGFMRLNFGCPRQVLRQALERIESAVRAVTSP